MSALRRRGLLVFVLAAAALIATCVAPALRRPVTSPPDFNPAGLSPGAARALSSARTAVVRDPSSGATWGQLGITLMACDLRDEALRCFTEASVRQPRQFRWPYLSGILLEDRDPLRADRSYSAALALKRDYAPLQWRRGQLLLRLDRLDASREAFESSGRLVDDSPWPLLGLAHVALAHGDVAEARRQLETARELAPWSRAVHVELAGVLRKLGQATDAWEQQQQASQLPEGPREMPDPVKRQVLEFTDQAGSLELEADELAARGELAQAAEVLRKLLAVTPDRSRPCVNLGQLLLAQGELGGARGVFRDAVERFPQEPLAHYGLASVCEAAGDAQSAIECYRRACELKPDYVEASYRLGVLLWRQNDAPAAVAALRRAVSAEPGLPPLRLALGLALRDAGEVDRAIEEVRIAVRLAPDDPEPARRLAELLSTAAGDFPQRPPSCPEQAREESGAIIP